jgi:hypothetical protein
VRKEDPLIRFVYTSTANAPFSQDDLVALLRTSSNNVRLLLKTFRSAPIR